MSEHDEAVHYAREVAKVEGKTPGRVWAERLIKEQREHILDMPMLFVADIDALLVHTKSLALHYNKYAATATEVRERLAFIAALATDLLEGFYPGESGEQKYREEKEHVSPPRNTVGTVKAKLKHYGKKSPRKYPGESEQ